jgi:hypothetical protein
VYDAALGCLLSVSGSQSRVPGFGVGVFQGSQEEPWSCEAVSDFEFRDLEFRVLGLGFWE